MKRFLVGCLVVLLGLSSAFADHFVTRTLISTDTADLTINVPEESVLRVIDFIQDGTIASPHYVTVTKGGRTVRVLEAGDADNPLARDSVVVAGPATVTVARPALAGITLFITYRKRGHDHGDP